MDLERQKRLDEVARIAVRLEAETQLPAQVLIAQWAVESKWGTKPVGQNNYFGMKKATRHEKCCVVTTHEVVNGKTCVMDCEFAEYDSLEDSCRDYAWLITSGDPYKKAWRQFLVDRNVAGLIGGIADIYATGLEYRQLVTWIAEQKNVAEAIARVA